MKHSLGLRYAVGSDAGVRRSGNEDSVFASPRLLAVADGMGGHAHGEVASAVVIGVLTELDDQLRTAKAGELDPLSALNATVARALRRLTELAEQDHELTMMGSTLTALLWDGTGFGLAHVGDSRGYLLRDGVLCQLTRDHTLVQSLVDEGRISMTEAAEHPRRSMLMRALQAGGSAEPDLTPQPAGPGDRVLVCSDGVTSVVGPDAVRDVLATAATPADAVRTLIDEATRLRSQDNVSCVVADVLADVRSGGVHGDGVLIAGAAAAEQHEHDRRTGPSWLPRWARQLLPG